MKKRLFIILLFVVVAQAQRSDIGSIEGVPSTGNAPIFNGDKFIFATPTNTSGSGVNYLISGGGVAYTGSGLSFAVAPAVYVIGGAQYTSVLTTVTLTAADGSNPRIDAIIVDNTGVATKVTGTAAASPVSPSIDPTSQLQLTFVTIPTSATTPFGIVTTNIYLEDTEWTCAVSDASNVCASTNNPFAGTKDVEGTTVAKADYVQFTNSTPVVLANYSTLAFYIRSKATWANNRSMTLAFQLGGVSVGGGVNFSQGSYGFNSSQTSTYQLIVIPLSVFGAVGAADRLRITVTGGGGNATIGYYLDNIILQSNISAFTQISNAQLQIFNVVDSGTFWTLPDGGQIVEVTACGAGGGGGGGSGAADGAVRAGGGGGGGSFCANRKFRAADITSTVLVTVGAGGTGGPGGSSASGTDGGAGNPSSFGSYLFGYGGGGGSGNSAGGGGGGGGGCQEVGASSTAVNGGVGGQCFIAGGNQNVAIVSGTGAGGTSAVTTPAASLSLSYLSGAGAGTSSTNGTADGGAGAGSMFSSAGGGGGGGVNAASPGTARNGAAGGITGGTVLTSGGGGTAGSAASACGAGGAGGNGNTAADTSKPGGSAGGGGAGVNNATGCNGGVGGIGGGGGGAGGGGTTVGGNGGNGGGGYVMVYTYF